MAAPKTQAGTPAMLSLAPAPLKKGLVAFPGATAESAALTTELLYKDFLNHHCFFNDNFFHDHVAHHVLSLYDLGASPDAIQALFNHHGGMQRDIFHGKPTAGDRTANAITEENWKDRMGEQHAHLYADLLEFFSAQIQNHGVAKTLEKFLFSPEANANGTVMLARFFGGAVHPIIQTGYGVEFGQDYMVAQGLALTVLTTAEGALFLEPTGLPEIRVDTPGTTSPSLLSVLRASTTHPKMPRMPFPGRFGMGIQGGSVTYRSLVDWVEAQPHNAYGTALREVFSTWSFDLTDADFEKKVDEIFWQAALIVGASTPAHLAPGKDGHRTRQDFFTMHLLTSAMALRPLLAVLPNAIHKAQLLQVYARTCGLLMVLRGTPELDVDVLMAAPLEAKYSAKGPGGAAAGSAWLPIIANACAHSETHLVKSIRALFYAAQLYGLTPAGGMPGAAGDGGETFKGAKNADGSVFLRVAGLMSNQLGWVIHGEKERMWEFHGMWEESWDVYERL
ncbi:hypothetical protein HMN09_00355100 [Mycena chlorophos]|uniref:Oxidoreductase AflY n=1 Tax=Mycena chlorophos TaxID=658473 RepID=A0A8H6WN56_MYCCL|nr:hypothetical protein HMN09_00355100 [Mycena chlorophos]